MWINSQNEFYALKQLLLSFLSSEFHRISFGIAKYYRENKSTNIFIQSSIGFFLLLNFKHLPSTTHWFLSDFFNIIIRMIDDSLHSLNWYSLMIDTEHNIHKTIAFIVSYSRIKTEATYGAVYHFSHYANKYQKQQHPKWTIHKQFEMVVCLAFILNVTQSIKITWKHLYIYVYNGYK